MSTAGGFREFEHGIDILRRMQKPVWFRYAEHTGLPPDIHIGFIAEDLEPVAPFMLTKMWTEPGQPPKLAIDYVAMLVTMFNVLCNLDERLQALEQKT